MKREVLRLGGYAREYFVSQTPELTQMADVVIDLWAQAWGPPTRQRAPLPSSLIDKHVAVRYLSDI